MSHITAMKTMPISFPGLFGDWEWNPDPIAIHVGHGIYWYGIILAAAMLCGMWLSMKQSKRYGLTEEDVANMVLWAVPLCILGSRTYYVLFNLDAYRNAAGGIAWGRAIAVWDGGIAIYGTVLMGILVALGFAIYRRVPFGTVADMAVPGLLLGQAIGRWANLINREAFGYSTELPWRMRLWYDQTTYMDVHPTFLYESLWNFVGLLLLLLIVSRCRRFDGENLCFYFLWYGTGRLWMEGLRTDSLYLFNVSFFGSPVRVSQLLSLCLALTGGAILWLQIKVRKRTPEGLYVNRLAAETAAKAAEAEAAAAKAAETAEAVKAAEAVETAEAVKAAETVKADGSGADGAESDEGGAVDAASGTADSGGKPDALTETASEPEREKESGTEGDHGDSA